MRNLRTIRRLSIALFLGALTAVGLASLASGNIPRPETASAVMDGTYRSAFEDSFDSAVPLRPAAVSFWSALEYSIFGTGLDGVLLGGDTLFTAEEWYTEPIYPQAWEAIGTAKAALESAGVQLLVLPIPAKSRILGESLPKPIPQEIQARYPLVLEQLARLGIQAVDLFAAFETAPQKEALFMRTDTHWSPEGASAAAEAVAAEVLRNFPTLAASLPRSEFATTSEGVRDFRGDLFEFLPSSAWFRPLPPGENITIYRTETLSSPELGLFDAPTIPVALVGTSYSAGENWNFEGFLKEALGADLVNLAEEGLGPFEPMMRALESGYFQDFGVQLVVWEIPERYLPTPGGAN